VNCGVSLLPSTVAAKVDQELSPSDTHHCRRQLCAVFSYSREFLDSTRRLGNGLSEVMQGCVIRVAVCAQGGGRPLRNEHEAARISPALLNDFLDLKQPIGWMPCGYDYTIEV
jgi:hypothetical protein